MSEGLFRAGVIGAGVFGGHHARQYAQLDGVTLSAVLDPHPERAASLAAPLGGRAFSDLAAFLEAVDVVTIAPPAAAHAELALAAVSAGKAIYVEKPLATTLEDARAIAEAARAKGVIVACGHQERAVFAAIGLLDIPESPRLLEALRHGPPTDRSRDVSAVLDLMVHDIDLALSLGATGPAGVEGQIGPNGVIEGARAQVQFQNGFTAAFDASRQAEARRRTMRLVYPSGVVEIDFVAGTFRNTTAFHLNPNFADTPAGRDPLGVSIEAFLAAVRGQVPRPLVTAEEAIRALSLALAVEAAL